MLFTKVFTLFLSATLAAPVSSPSNVLAKRDVSHLLSKLYDLDSQVKELTQVTEKYKGGFGNIFKLVPVKLAAEQVQDRLRWATSSAHIIPKKIANSEVVGLLTVTDILIADTLACLEATKNKKKQFGMWTFMVRANIQRMRASNSELADALVRITPSYGQAMAQERRMKVDIVFQDLIDSLR